jgi:hypothetical protein
LRIRHARVDPSYAHIRRGEYRWNQIMLNINAEQVCRLMFRPRAIADAATHYRLKIRRGRLGSPRRKPHACKEKRAERQNERRGQKLGAARQEQ